MHTGLGQKKPRSQTVTSFFSRAPLTFLRAFCLSTMGRDDMKQFKKTQHYRGVCTSTRAVTSTFKSSTSTRAVACTVIKKIASSAGVTICNDLLLDLRRWDCLSHAPSHAPPPLCLPLVQQCRETSRAQWGRRQFYGVFLQLPLDSSSTSAAAGAAGAVGTVQGAVVWTIPSCVSGQAMPSPGCHQRGRCKRTPCGSSWWWRMCSWRARSQCCCPLRRPRDRRLSGGQLRPSDRAMAARSARVSSSEEESRSTEEEERSLTKRCIERQWKNTRETLSEREWRNRTTKRVDFRLVKRT